MPRTVRLKHDYWGTLRLDLLRCTPSAALALLLRQVAVARCPRADTQLGSLFGSSEEFLRVREGSALWRLRESSPCRALRSVSEGE